MMTIISCTNIKFSKKTCHLSAGNLSWLCSMIFQSDITEAVSNDSAEILNDTLTASRDGDELVCHFSVVTP